MGQRHRLNYGITGEPVGRQPSVTFRTGDSQKSKKNQDAFGPSDAGGRSFHRTADRSLDNAALVM